MRSGTILIIAAAFAVTGLGVRAASVSIDQSGQQFSERAIAVKTGDSLVFLNRDDVTHNVNVIDDDDEATDLGLQKPGQNLSHTFDKRGRFKVRCSIHPSMKMTVNVK